MNVDWQSIFAIDTPILEIIVRGSVVYWSLFILLRIIGKREAGAIGITDLLVVVLLADAVQSGMIGESHSVTDAIVLVVVILFWSYFLDWIGYRFPWVQRMVHPGSLILVKNGRIIKRHLDKELLTEEELLAELRKKGVDDLQQVKAAYMEGDGHFSVITHNQQK
jgi:uncharacterized membrane protein YcaP (DUF421 family)